MRSRKWIFSALILAVPVMSEARPWNEHVTRLMTLTRQIEVGEQEILHMIEEKRHTYDPKKVNDLVRQIETRHKAVLKAVKDYEEERTHVRFQHPEKNDQLDRNYVRHEVKSLESMENDFGIDARLDRVKARVLAKFPITEKKPADIKKFRTRLPASKPEVPDEDAPEKITLTK